MVAAAKQSEFRAAHSRYCLTNRRTRRPTSWPWWGQPQPRRPYDWFTTPLSWPPAHRISWEHSEVPDQSDLDSPPPSRHGQQGLALDAQLRTDYVGQELIEPARTARSSDPRIPCIDGVLVLGPD